MLVAECNPFDGEGRKHIVARLVIEDGRLWDAILSHNFRPSAALQIARTARKATEEECVLAGHIQDNVCKVLEWLT